MCNNPLSEVIGSGLPEVDGLYAPSAAPSAQSKARVVRTPGYWKNATRLRFDTVKEETLPTVELLQSRSKAKCVEIHASKNREVLYALLRDHLAIYTDRELMDQPFSEKA